MRLLTAGVPRNGAIHPASGLVVVRHGLSEDNVAGICPRWRSTLVAAGGQQARQAARVLAASGLPLGQVICSDLDRAVETGDLLCSELNLRRFVDRRFREIDFGEATGLGDNEFRSAFRELVPGAENASDWSFKWPAGEVRGRFAMRVIGALTELSSRATGIDIVVTHWAVTAMGIAHRQKDLAHWTAHGLQTGELCGFGALRRDGRAGPSLFPVGSSK